MKYIERLAPRIASLISDIDDRDICKHFEKPGCESYWPKCEKCYLMGVCWNKELLEKLFLSEIEE